MHLKKEKKVSKETKQSKQRKQKSHHYHWTKQQAATRGNNPLNRTLNRGSEPEPDRFDWLAEFFVLKFRSLKVTVDNSNVKSFCGWVGG